MTSRVRRGLELRRPWIDGRLRMVERAAAVGSVLSASLFAFSSSGSVHIFRVTQVSAVFVHARADFPSAPLRSHLPEDPSLGMWQIWYGVDSVWHATGLRGE